MDLTHDMIGVEDYELRAARMAALRPDKCPVTDRFRTEVKAVLTGMSLKTVTATSTGNTLVVRFHVPALGKNRTMEATAPSYGHQPVYRYQEVLNLLFSAFMQTAFKRGLIKGMPSSVDGSTRTDRCTPTRRAWLKSEWTVRSWSDSWKSSVMKRVAEETGKQCIAVGVSGCGDVDVKAAFAAVLHDMGLTATVASVVSAMSHNTIASEKRKTHAVRTGLDSLRPALRNLLSLGVDHDELKSMIDEEIVKLVQES
jgi:hypothetical protein